MLNLLLLLVIFIVLIPISQFIDTSSPPQTTQETSPVTSEKASIEPKIIDGKDMETGLIVDKGWEEVKTNCTRCHNAKIILQNRFDKKGWKELIVWMQETQGLWKLGENEEVILDYLAKNYAPEVKGRRVPLQLKEEDWYILEE